MIFPARFSVALLALGLCGCAASVSVEQPFPAPLVDALPLRMAIHYPESLVNFVHKEESGPDRDWTVQLGAANVRMFDALFAGIFEHTQRIGAVEAAAQEMPSFNGIIAASIDAFEFALPSQASADQYAVWIRYNLDVYGADGQLLVRWPVSAYGQSGTSGINEEKAMERAIVLAMRDAAATIAVNFAKQPKIRQGLLHEDPSASP